MASALRKEHQLPITLNLLRQLPEETILVPERISVDLSLIYNEGAEIHGVEQIDTVLELSKATLKDLEWVDLNEPSVTFPEQHYAVTINQNFPVKPQLSLNTEVQVFGEEVIRMHQSGLTIPFLLTELADDAEVTIQYRIDKNTGYDFRLKK